MRTTLLLAISLIFGPLLAGQKKPVTLEALNEWRGRSRANTPGEAVWAPDGKTFLFRQGSDLMWYDIAKTEARRVMDLTPLDEAAQMPPAPEKFGWENRRVDEQTLQWNPAGGEALYATHGDLFWIDVAKGKQRQLTRTAAAERDPKISPDGKQVAFLRDWDLYTLDIASGKETRLTTGGSDTVRNGAPDWVYPEELELGTAYWWSPDSHAILYLQFDISGEPLYPHEDLRGTRAIYEPQRYPQAGDNNASIRLGIVERGGGETKWINPGDTVKEYLIPRAGWLPNSKSVYAVRTNRVQNELEFLAYDVAAGTQKTIYKEKDERWVNVEEWPIFLRSGKGFVWTSERDGRREAFHYSLDGGKRAKLTGQGVASLACVNEERVYFTSSNGPSGLDRRLYSVALEGAQQEAEAVTKENGSHRISMAPGCGHFLDTYSNLTTAPETVLRSANGAKIATYRPMDRRAQDELDLRPTEIATFAGPEHSTLYGRLIKPPNFDPSKKYPVIVQVYGGPHVQSVRNAWPGVDMDQVFANAGFVVWQVDNRGTFGRGHSFEAPVYRNLGKIELEDQRAGVEYLISLGFVDRERIGVNGWSYGGFMTLNMLLNAPDVFKAGFAGAPVTNWLNYDTIYTERYMGSPKENAAGYARTSLIPQAKNLRGKLMIAHNIEDDNVLFQNTLQMIQALESEGKHFELSLYTQKTHGVGGGEQRQLESTMLDFFKRTLLDKSLLETPAAAAR